MIIAFILDGTILKYAPYSLFSILIFIFMNKKNLLKYYFLSFIIGLFYDFFYSNLLFYNSFIFLTCAFIIYKLQNKLEHNLLNSLIIALITIVYYYTITFIILLCLNYIPFDFKRYLNILLNSSILNIFFILIVYLIKKKKHIYYC